MIIKRVSICEEEAQQSQPRENTRAVTPRVIIKMKKTAKMQSAQQTSQTLIPESENNSFNDTDYFAGQHRLVSVLSQQKETPVNHNHIQTVKNKNRQNSSDVKRLQASLEGNEGVSRNLFLEYLKKESFQASQVTQLHHPQSKYSGRERKYSCVSNRKEPLEAPDLLSTHQSAKQADSSKELPKCGVKLATPNPILVNPYTQKEYFHQRVTNSSKDHRFEKLRSLNYSFIKPNEIKAVSLNVRNIQKTTSRKKHQRKQFPQLIAALKRKQQLWAQRPRMNRQQARLMMQTSYLHQHRVQDEEKRDANELQPWEVEGQLHFTDII